MLTNSDEIVYDCYYKLMIILLVTNNVVGNDFENFNKENEKLFDKYLRDYGIQIADSKRFEMFKIFTMNIVLQDYLNKKYTTALFGVNKFAGITFDDFVKGYTGFNGAGLTDEGVVEFDPKFTGQVPIVMDWTNILTRYEMSHCRNSYVYSAISKYCIYSFLS